MPENVNRSISRVRAISVEFDARMIHAGLPVTKGVKWMASRWIRGTDFLGGV